MTPKNILMGGGLLIVGIGIGALFGYSSGVSELSDFGKRAGKIMSSLCANQGYEGAFYPLDDISEARCVNRDEMAGWSPTE